MADPFDTLNDAFYSAANAVREKFGNQEEAISILYELGGKFYFADPVGRGSDNRTAGQFKIPKAARLRGIVHNHPEADLNDRFSPDDIENAERLGVPSAIIFGSTAPQIRLFTPGQTPVRKDHRLRYSYGEPYAPEPVQITARPL
jgi:hypothetical protein